MATGETDMEHDEYKIMGDIEDAYWWFVGKQFLVEKVLNEYCLGDTGEARILDIGCGTGGILKLMKKYGAVCGIDFSPAALEFSKQSGCGCLVCSDVGRHIPFKDNTFTAVTCLDVMEHLDNEGTLLEETFRVCKPGGHIVITVPAFNALWSAHDEALHHKRRYTRRQMLRRIDRLNCSVIKVSYFNTLLFIPILVTRKLKGFLDRDKPPRSDFFMKLPGWINTALRVLYTAEIVCLSRLNFPFGVSLLVILQKPDTGDGKAVEKEPVSRIKRAISINE